MIRKLIKNIKWSTLFFEVFSIVLAILLALWVNQYQQEKENQKNALVHLEQNNKEVKRNFRKPCST